MHILMTGATGLLGQGVLHEVLADAGVERIGVLGRNPPPREHPRIQDLRVDRLDALDRVEGRLPGWDACFYCAGATPIGTPAPEYRRVTVDLTLHVAQAYARHNPAGRFLYVSGANADPGSWLMPLRVKGEAEAALSALPVGTILLRPGAIQPVHGERSPHAALRPFYALGGPAMGLGLRWLPGLVTTTAAMGRAMLALARMPHPPAIVENAGINRLGANP